jgi:osmotically-inducible protein OsmY
MISDNQLQQDVLDELEFEPRVKAAHIGVVAKASVVTLTGFVTSNGVKAIAEEIEVRLPVDKKRADDEIAERAVRILHWDELVPDDRIAIKVENGMVTLAGTVDWQHQKSEAEYDVRKLSGVVAVINQLHVKSAAAASEVKGQIERALRRNAQVEASGIRVETSGGSVTLKGKVHDWFERDLIERAAWSVAGVTEVHDRLTVEP